MKKRFSEEQIIKILGGHKTWKRVKDIARDHGISENTFYIWEQKYGEMSIKEIARLLQLEDENTKLKKLVADLFLDNMAQKEIIKKSCFRQPASNQFLNV
jgi:putative transposase